MRQRPQPLAMHDTPWWTAGMVTRPKADPALTDVAVRAELFYLNLQDELAGRSNVSPEDMQAAFVRALQNTVADLPGLKPIDTEAPAEKLPEPVRHSGARPSRRWRPHLRAALVALAVATLLRVSAFLVFGQ